LHKFPVTTPLGILAPVDLAEMVALEGKGKLRVVGGHEAGERDCEVKTHCDRAISVVGEGINLLIGFATTLAQENLGILEDRGINRYVPETSKNPF